MFPIESVSIRKGLKDKNMKLESTESLMEAKELDLVDLRELMVDLDFKVVQYNSHVKAVEKAKDERTLAQDTIYEQLNELYPYVTGTLINWEGEPGKSEILSITVPEKS